MMTDKEIRAAIQPIRIRSEAEVQADARRSRQRHTRINIAVIVLSLIGLALLTGVAGGQIPLPLPPAEFDYPEVGL